MAYCVVWQYVSRTHRVLTQWVPSPAAPAGGCCAPLVRTRAYAATEGYSQGTSTVPNKVKERYTSPLNRLYGTPTVLRPPAEHARLLRVVVAVCVGRSGQCTALCGAPRRVRAGWGRVLAGHRVLTQWIGRSAVHHRLVVGERHAVQRVCAAPRRVLYGG